MVPGDREHRRAERAQERGGPLVLVAPAAVRQVAARDHQLRVVPLQEGLHRALEVGILVGAEVEVGDVENACHVGRSRLYSDLK